MKKLLLIGVVSTFALVGCKTTDTAPPPDQTDAEKACEADPTNPKCETGGGATGPIRGGGGG